MEQKNTGNIRFESFPRGAFIFIDKQFDLPWVTPITITNVSIGVHEYHLRASGKEKNDDDIGSCGTVTVVGGQTSLVSDTLASIDFQWQEKRGWLNKGCDDKMKKGGGN